MLPATFVLAAWTWFAERRPWMKKLAVIVFAGVVAQAIIGGVRVHFPAYKPLIAIPHALIAQSFFGAVVSLAVFTSRRFWARQEVKPDAGSPRLLSLVRATVSAVLIQLVLGAGFRHQAFGIIPHIVGAIVVAALVVWTAVTVFVRHQGDRFLARPALSAVVLLAVQVALGISAYMARLASTGDPQPLEPMISLTVMHLIVGALLLATMIVLTLRCYRALAEGHAAAREQTLAQSPRRAAV